MPTLTEASAATIARPRSNWPAARRSTRGSEVQKAYNAVEEAIWSRVFADGVPERYAVVLPCVSAAFGAAKDELAREYVKLAAGAHAPMVDVTALFRGG